MDKRVAPTAWAMIIIAIILCYSAAFISIPILIVRIIGFIVAACLVGAVVAVLRERYKELKGGETDDLSNY